MACNATTFGRALGKALGSVLGTLLGCAILLGPALTLGWADGFSLVSRFTLEGFVDGRMERLDTIEGTDDGTADKEGVLEGGWLPLVLVGLALRLGFDEGRPDSSLAPVGSALGTVEGALLAPWPSGISCTTDGCWDGMVDVGSWMVLGASEIVGFEVGGIGSNVGRCLRFLRRLRNFLAPLPKYPLLEPLPDLYGTSG